MIYIKEGVIVGSPMPDLIRVIGTVACAFSDGYGDCWITSMADGVHNGKPVDSTGKDPHYVGKAVDFRIQNIVQSRRRALIEDIDYLLRRAELYCTVLWEAQGQPNEHIHVQLGHPVP